MQTAYTVVYGMGERHWNVGATYPTRELAEQHADGASVQEVTCYIDDFDEVNAAKFMFRTDGNHEVSFVVDEYGSQMDWGLTYPEHARINTAIRN
jgi:hypothetical protein